jgi:hypothetical protein
VKQTKFCTSCGEQLDGAVSFCGSCGAPVNEARTGQAEPTTISPDRRQEDVAAYEFEKYQHVGGTTDDEKWPEPKPATALAVIAILVCVGVIVLFIGVPIPVLRFGTIGGGTGSGFELPWGFIGVWFLLAVLVGALRRRRGGSFFIGFLSSAFLSPLVGFILLAVAPRRDEIVEERLIRSGDRRRCPFCQEVIRRDARVCKHCHRDLRAP